MARQGSLVSDRDEEVDMASGPVGGRGEVEATTASVTEQVVPAPGAFPVGKPVERLTLKVEFDTPMDSAALAELIAAVKLYGTVVEAKHAVLRRYSRELV